MCILVTDLDAPTGGIQKNTRLLLEEFRQRQIKVFVCARNYYGRAKNEAGDGAVVHRSPVVGGSMALNGILYLADTFWWLVRNRRKYDVIHCQQMFGPTMAAAVASFFVKKPIVTRITLSGETGEVGAVKNLPFAGLRLKLIRRVSRWVALTREMKGELVTLGIPPERIRIIHNSTEIPEGAAFSEETKTEMRRKHRLEYGKICVFVGRLSEEKNLDVLIDAWADVSVRHGDAHLLLLGAGGEYRNAEATLRRLTASLALEDAVHFLGHVDNAKEYILASDVFVLPTRAEGMSNALVEAFACGAAIVATDIPANKEICEDGINSLLIPVGDKAALTESISAVLESHELRHRIGKAARERAENDLSVDGMLTAYLETYREAIG